jgi:hypothetical protein
VLEFDEDETANIAEYDRGGGGGGQLCCGEASAGMVVLTGGTMTGQRYIDDILDNQVR